MRGGMLTYFWLLLTVALTVYGQLAFKWRIDVAGEFPAATGERLEYGLRLAIDPWVISVVVAVALGSITYAAALSRAELSFAYPFMSLSFVAVLLLSGLIFGESVTPAKVVGVALIVAGVLVGSQ